MNILHNIKSWKLIGKLWKEMWIIDDSPKLYLIICNSIVICLYGIKNLTIYLYGVKNQKSKITNIMFKTVYSLSITQIQLGKLLQYILFSQIVDIDECSTTSPCDTNADCTNTVGSHSCACKVGYSGNGLTCSGIVLI